MKDRGLLAMMAATIAASTPLSAEAAVCRAGEILDAVYAAYPDRQPEQIDLQEPAAPGSGEGDVA